MAKRARGSVRPGQRRPIDRRPAGTTGPATTAKPATAATPKPSGLSDAELERAAQLEAQLLAEEKAAEQARMRTRVRATREPVPTAAAASFAAQEALDYAYVARDVKDIVRIASLLIGILIVLFILVDVVGVFKVGA